MKRSVDPLIDEATIRRRVAELAAEITSEFAGRDIVVLPVLKGGAVFGMDLIRALTIPVQLDFIRARSYEGGRSTGHVEFLAEPTLTLCGKTLLIVEDILDTGRTTSAIVERLLEAQPAAVEVCVLLDKASGRVVPINPRFVGFEIKDRFVIGYGLDYNEQYRELPAIYTLDWE
ncbi:MAG: hypoxanthine phosphoribosyltransferase [Candidatus Hydrogenedentes bacterium]|jgi:hypoxanthine phosphoribosyltransferase|nr:hypoxanthine phosphoribosyltransferase [Candidatus Hydrogenedentota bacterium]